MSYFFLSKGAGWILSTLLKLNPFERYSYLAEYLLMAALNHIIFKVKALFEFYINYVAMETQMTHIEKGHC